MIRDPLVSIIITNYNYERYIKDAINSALNQTYPNVEVIVVDDGSIDDSKKIILQFGKTIIGIFKENNGQTSAINTGFTNCTGTYIIFLDSDDILLPTALEKAVGCFVDPQVVKVHWAMLKIDDEGIRTGTIVPAAPLADGDYLTELIKQGPNHSGGPEYSPPSSGIVWSRKYLENVFPLPENKFKNGCSDYLLSSLAPVFGTIRSLPEPYGCYRVHGRNSTLKPLDQYFKQFFFWFELSCEILSHHLAQKNFFIDSKKWPRDSWYHQIYLAMQDISVCVRSGETLILIDGNNFGSSGILEGRYCIPFTEKNGVYNGEPRDDASAISEIERQRINKVNFLVFAWPAFWYLDHYIELNQYLRKHYSCVLQNERVIVFDLQSNWVNFFLTPASTSRDCY